MAFFSLPEHEEPSGFLTTGDVARLLERTPRGTRWLADDQHIHCERTENGTRLYRKKDVQGLLDRRAHARLKGVKVLRPKRLGTREGPRQLSLFGPRLVVDPLPGGEVHSAQTLRKTHGSDNARYVHRLGPVMVKAGIRPLDAAVRADRREGLG